MKISETRRAKMLKKFKKYVEKHRYSRAQMTLILTVTGLAGFLCSVALLHLGLGIIWMRYLLSICVAYAVFLFLVRIWLAYHRRNMAGESGSYDRFDIGGFHSGGGSSFTSAPYTGGGGTFGGGASGSFETPALETPALVGVSEATEPAATASGISIPTIDLDSDSASILVAVAVIAAIVSALAASAYVIFAAPQLLAELLLNGALSAGLSLRLRGIERENWLETAVQKTWVPVAVVMLFFVLTGLLMHWYTPEAKSVSDVWRHSHGHRSNR